KIKIDQCFVRDLGATDGARFIVSTIIGLGRSLNMLTTAEGVETEEQLAWLRAEGCDEVQGYLLGRPVTLEEFEKTYIEPSAKQAEMDRAEP
ncbi:MAG: EAL domain-containing protein, partial [Betaproteobacteria bacterium]